jgi:hypothetical protein
MEDSGDGEPHIRADKKGTEKIGGRAQREIAVSLRYRKGYAAKSAKNAFSP